MTQWTLWGTSGGNNNADNADPVSLGTKFRVLTGAGITRAWVIGVAYYRGTLSGGTKTARLYRTSDQTLLSGTAAFTDSGTGWQYAYFATAVEVTLGATSYTAAVHFPVGAPSFTSDYFTAGGPGASGITNGPLYAPNSEEAFGQAVFTTGSTPACPTSSFNGANYWVTPIITDVNPDQITPNGIAPVGGIGQPALTATITITPDGIPTSGGIGQPGVEAGAFVINPTGIAPSGGTGSPTISPGNYVMNPSGIAPTGGAGSPALTPRPVVVAPEGIAPAGGVGSPWLLPAGEHLPDWAFTVGPPRTGWRIGPPRT